MVYESHTRHRRPRRLVLVGAVLLVVLAGAGVLLWHAYQTSLGAVNSSTTRQAVTIASASSVTQISTQLQRQGLIRKSWAFDWYVKHTGLASKLQAGTYMFSPSQSTPTIARAIAAGKVSTDLVTILPGKRLTQIRQTLVDAKFDAAAVDAALQPQANAASPILADIPSGASLEGFLYPDSYQKDASTTPQHIIEQSLAEMATQLTPDLRAAYAREGFNAYQAVTLASVVEQEVSRQSDRAQAAQVFIKRLSVDMPLGSDVTADYGALAAGLSPSLTYDSPYNTLIHKGLPPGPISNVSASSLEAVAHPAATDWLYFVAGDNGNTYFSKTLAEHDALTKQYCHELCNL